MGKSRSDDVFTNWVPSEPRIVNLKNEEVEITAMAVNKSGIWFFVGKSDESILLYSTSEGVEQMDVRTGIRHKVPTSQLLLNQANDPLLVSDAESDAVWDLTGSAKSPLFDSTRVHHLAGSITR